MNDLRLQMLKRLVIAVVLSLAAAALYWRGVDAGAACVQSKWDAQKQADAQQALQLAQERAREQALINRNAERTAYEDHRREQARAARLAAAQRAADGLRDAIAKLDADDLSAAAADPRVAAVAQRAITARELLGSCSARYTGLAGRADRLRDQVAGLRAFALNVCHAGEQPADETKKEEAQ